MKTLFRLIFSLAFIIFIACSEKDDLTEVEKPTQTTDTDSTSNNDTVITDTTVVTDTTDSVDVSDNTDYVENILVSEIQAMAGLMEDDGTKHIIHTPNKTTGNRINVVDYGADIEDNSTDDTPAIEDAIRAAEEGDEVYFPDGVYNLRTSWSSSSNTNIYLQTKVNFVGESESGTILRSYFDCADGNNYYVVKASGVNNIHMENFTITSNWSRDYSIDPTENNDDFGGPTYSIITADAKDNFAYNITFENITVMKFWRGGIRIDAGSHDIVITSCTARNATDVGGGGAGYGFLFQGTIADGEEDNPNLNTLNDNYFNVLKYSKAVGPYIRHGALLQYYAHNNLIDSNTFSNTAYGAIDLHGEDEYANEITRNTIRDVSEDAMTTGSNGGGGIELGNSGSTHDKTGPYNWIHDNRIINSNMGVRIEFGTTNTLIEGNVVVSSNSISNSSGIYMGYTENAIVKDNYIHDNSASGFSGIYMFEGSALDNVRAGSPLNCEIYQNKIIDNTNGTAINIIEQETGNVITENTTSGNLVDYEE